MLVSDGIMRKEILMKNKNILFAISRLTGGGAERVVSMWSNMLSSRDYKTHILLAYRSENEYSVNDQVKIITIANSESEYLHMGLLKKIITIRHIICENKIGCIIPFLPAMQILIMLSSFGMKCKRVDTIRVNPWKMSSVSGKIGKILWKHCFTTSDKIIVQTEEQCDFFAPNIRKKCIVISNPIGEEYYKKDIYRSIYSIKKCIAVGRVCSQKNYEMMIEGFSDVVKKNPFAKLDIYGEAEVKYCKKIQSLIIKLGLENNVFLKGRHDDMDTIYSMYDVFCMTSNFEGLPNALIEAMASGLICVSTDCKTGPKDLINNGVNGFLVTVGSRKQFAETLIRINAMNTKKLSFIANKARDDVLNHCSAQNVLYELCTLIDSL